MPSIKNFNAKQSSRIQARWLENAMKSLGHASDMVLQNIAPNLYTVASDTRNVSLGLAKSLIRNRNNINRINAAFDNNKFVKAAKTAYKNTLIDIKEGNIFGNSERGAEAFQSSDDGFSFGDEGITEGATINNYGASNEALGAISNDIRSVAVANTRMQKATMDAYIAVSAAGMSQIGELGSQMVSHMESMSSSLSALVEYNNTNMTKFINAATAFMEKTGPRLSSGEDKESDEGLKLKQSVISGGKFNLNNYKKLVKKQFKTALSNTQLGFLNDMLDDGTLDMLASNPLGFLGESMVRAIVPKALTTSIQAAEQTFNNMMPSLLSRLAELGEKEGGGLGDSIARLIGQSLGLDLKDRKNKFNTSIKKGVIGFDNDTKVAITEIITKELREQTGYLRILAEKAVGRKRAQQKLRDNERFFDYNSGKYISNDDINKAIANQIGESLRTSFGSTEFGIALNSLSSKTENEKQKKELDKLVENFYSQIIQESGNQQLSPEYLISLVESTTTRGSYSKYAKKLLTNEISKLNALNNRAFKSASAARMNAKLNLDTLYKEIEENSDRNYLRNSAFNSNDKDILEIFRDINGKSDVKRKTFNKVKSKNEDFVNINDTRGSRIMDRVEATANEIVSNLFIGNYKGALNALTGIGGSLTKSTGNKLESVIFGKGNNKSLFEEMNNIGFSLKRLLFGEGKALRKEAAERGIDEEYVDDYLRQSGISDSYGGIFGKIKTFFDKGFQGWSSVLFGDDEDAEKYKEDIVERAKDSLGSTLTGSLVGAGLGTLAGSSILGALVGGPIGGAILGAASGFVSKNERFQKWVFGELEDPEHPEKGRVGGFISKATQQFFKDNKLLLGGSATIGAVAGTITGGGLLGTIVGGPIAGSLLGLAGGILAGKGTFHDFLFGNEEKGKKSIFQNIAMGFKKGAGLSKNNDTGIAMGTIGAGAGVLSTALLSQMGVIGASLTPLGPIGGALLGFAAGIRAEGKNLKEFLWGKKNALDMGGGQKRDSVGLFGRIGNSLLANLITPLKNSMSNLLEDMGYTIKNQLLTPISILGGMLSQQAGKLVGGVGDFVKGVTSSIFSKDGFLVKTFPFLEKALAGGVKGFLQLAWQPVKAVLSAPAKVLGAVFNRPFRLITKTVSSGMKFIGGIVSGALDKFTNKLTAVIKAPFRLLGWFGKGIANSRVGRWVGNRIGDTREKISSTRRAIADRLHEGNERFWGGFSDTNTLRGKFGKLIGWDEEDPDSFFKQWQRSREESREEKKALEEERRWRKENERSGKIVHRLTNGNFGTFNEDAKRYLVANAKQFIGQDVNIDDENAVNEYLKSLGIRSTTLESHDKSKFNIANATPSSIRRTSYKYIDSPEGKIFKFMSESENKWDKFRDFITHHISQGDLLTQNADNSLFDNNTDDTGLSDYLDWNDSRDSDEGGYGNRRRKRGGRGIITSLLGGALGLLGKGGSGLLSTLFGGNKEQEPGAIRNAVSNIVGRRRQRDYAQAQQMRRSSAQDYINRDIAEDSGGVNEVRARDAINKQHLADIRSSAMSVDKLKAQREKEKEEAREKREDLIQQATSGLYGMASKFTKSWGGIFGNKGLLTVGMLYLLGKFPSLLNGIIGAINTVANIAGNVSGFIGDFVKNGSENTKKRKEARAGENGLESTNTFDAIGKGTKNEIKNIKKGNIFTDEYGNVKNTTESFTKMGFVVGSDIAKTAAFGKNPITKEVAQVVLKTGAKTGGKVLNNITNILTKGFKTLGSVIAKKFPNIAAKASSIVEKAGNNVIVKALKEKWASVASKIMEKLGFRINAETAAAATGVGIVADIAIESAGSLISVLFGIGGTAKLFGVPANKVDMLMRILATAWHAFSGTLAGAIIELFCELVASAGGPNYIQTLLTTIYNYINADNEDKIASLKEAQDNKLKQWEDEVKNPELKRAFNDQKANGKIDNSTTFDEFCAMVESGNIKVEYQGYDSWQADKDKSVGDRIGGAVGGIFKLPKRAEKKKQSILNDAKLSGIDTSAILANNGSGYTIPQATYANSSYATYGRGGRGGRGLISSTVGNIMGSSVRKVIKNLGTGKQGVSISGSSVKWNVNIDGTNPQETMLRQLGGIGEILATNTSISSNLLNTVSQVVGFVGSIANSKIGRGVSSIVSGIRSTAGSIRQQTRSGFNNFLTNTINKASSLFGGKGGNSYYTGGRGNDTIVGSYFSQNDDRWSNMDYSVPFDQGTMSDSGCGPTAMAMAANDAFNSASASGVNVNPVGMATLAKLTGNRDETGTNWNYINDASYSLGLNSRPMYQPSPQELDAELSTGNPVILSGAKGGRGGKSGRDFYTTEGHYNVAERLPSDPPGIVRIKDPRGPEYSGITTVESIAPYTNASWTISGGYGNKTKQSVARKNYIRRAGGRGLIRNIRNNIKNKMLGISNHGGRGSLNIRKDHLVNNPNSTSGTRDLSKVKAIVIHYTAGPAGETAANVANYFRTTVRAGAHFSVDRSGEVYQSFDLNQSAHAVGGNLWADASNTGGGQYYNKYTNYNTVSIEMCDNRMPGHEYPSDAQIRSIKQLIKYIKSECPNVERIVRHFDINGKPCPLHMCKHGVVSDHIATHPAADETANWDKFLKDLGSIGVAGSRSKSGKRSGKVTGYQKWIGCIKAIKAAWAEQHPKYTYGGSGTLNVAGRQLKIRTDCSGMVGACLQLFGVFQEGYAPPSGSYGSGLTQLSNAGFKYTSWPNGGWNDLIPGTIVASSHHMEIFAGMVNGKPTVWNCGGDNSCSNPNPTSTSNTSYPDVWIPRNPIPGESCPDGIADISVDGGISEGESSSGGKAKVKGNSASKPKGLSGALSYLGAAFSTMVDRAFNGKLSNTDYSWQTIMGASDTSSGSSDDYEEDEGTGGGHAFGGNTFTGTHSGKTSANIVSTDANLFWTSPLSNQTTYTRDFNSPGQKPLKGGIERPMPKALLKAQVENNGLSTYMGWGAVTAGNGSFQGRLKQQVPQQYDSSYHGLVTDGSGQDRVAVATKRYFGVGGDYIDIYLKNGKVIPAIIGDVKGNENWGKLSLNGRTTSKNMGDFAIYAHGEDASNAHPVEYIVNQSGYESISNGSGLGVVGHDDWHSPIVSIVNRGSYWGGTQEWLSQKGWKDSVKSTDKNNKKKKKYKNFSDIKREEYSSDKGTGSGSGFGGRGSTIDSIAKKQAESIINANRYTQSSPGSIGDFRRMESSDTSSRRSVSVADQLANSVKKDADKILKTYGYDTDIKDVGSNVGDLKKSEYSKTSPSVVSNSINNTTSTSYKSNYTSSGGGSSSGNGGNVEVLLSQAINLLTTIATATSSSDTKLDILGKLGSIESPLKNVTNKAENIAIRNHRLSGGKTVSVNGAGVRPSHIYSNTRTTNRQDMMAHRIATAQTF